MKTFFSTLSVLLITAHAVLAQAVPFDMSKERPEPDTSQPAQQTPAPAQTPADAQATSPAIPTAAPVETAQKPAVATDVKRNIIPFDKLEFSGEIGEKTWSLYLTPEQAASSATLNIGYQNSIFVAPEMSRLTVRINDQTIADEPVSSPDGVKALKLDIAAGVLQPGANLISFQSTQRHRTDCSIESTYELWTNIDPAKTFLDFSNASARGLARIDDVRGIGVDDSGQTEFRFVVPALEQPAATTPLLRLAQGLALLSNMPNQSFTFDTRQKTTPGSGQMAIFVGTAAELLPILPALPATANTTPTVSFLPDPATNTSAMIISGPTWQAVQAAIDSIVTPTDRVHGVRRELLMTERWHSPDAPLLFSDTSLQFSQLGIKTTEFSGRRFRTEFTIGIPADFYADAYGEASILLDAAYSQAVLPGSHIDVYVNGSIASTLPITSSGGGLYRHLPIRVTMRHFKPGLNSIAIEAIMSTNEDKACAPGSTASTTPRFALFDTSAFHMPDFARVGQRPNLAATAGIGFPYNETSDPVPLMLDRIDRNTLSATATLLARMAVAAGRPVPIEIAASPMTVGNRSAVFIGSISQVPPMVLTQMKIDATAITTWAAGDQTTGREGNGTNAAVDEWRSRLQGSGWGLQLNGFRDWLKRNFDISGRSLRFLPQDATSFSPPASASLLISQSESPDSDGTWTLIAAPTGDDLQAGMQSMASQANWEKVEGRYVTYNADDDKIETVPVISSTFIPTQPPSIANYRLIAANWLSTNILFYAVLLIGLAIALGLATAGFLSNLGREK